MARSALRCWGSGQSSQCHYERRAVPSPTSLPQRAESRPTWVQLGALVTETAHGVTGVASLILLADISDQRLGALHFDFERSDQRIFGVNDDVSGFALNFKADRKLHLCLPLSMLKNVAQFSCEVELLGPVRFSICEDMTKPTTGDQL